MQKQEPQTVLADFEKNLFTLYGSSLSGLRRRDPLMHMSVESEFVLYSIVYFVFCLKIFWSERSPRARAR